jgi:hypothetical protein
MKKNAPSPVIVDLSFAKSNEGLLCFAGALRLIDGGV